MIADNADDIRVAIREDRKIAEQYLLRYRELLQRYRETKEEYLAAAPANGPRGSSPSDPTAALAARSVQYDLESTEYYWLKAVEIVEQTLSADDKAFLLYRRRAHSRCRTAHGGRPAWIAYTQACLCRRNLSQWYSEPTLKRRWQRLITQTLLVKNKLQN